MNKEQLIEQIKKKKSFLCVGLDPDLEKLPEHLLDLEDPITAFNKEIIEATSDLCVAYKPNIAFFECYGERGWKSLRQTWELLPKDVLSIADAKRGDIGNTAARYAKAFFDTEISGLGFDAITVAPYMGKDSVQPFTAFDGKWAVVLGLTSNQGSEDFQMLSVESSGPLYQEVLRKVKLWASTDNLMFVVGATKGEYIQDVRAVVPDHFLLVPGVGAQGGSLIDVCNYGMNKDCGLLVNSTRGIIYASNGRDFADRARDKALELQREMEEQLYQHKII